MKQTPIDGEEIIAVNRKFGGKLRPEANLEFAEMRASRVRSNYTKAAYYVRSIIVDHAFTDGNKRTAFYVVGKLVGIEDQKEMARTITRISKDSEHDIEKIVWRLKNANRKD